ncbi:hypothetical protein [Microbacterium sp. zg-B185]|uniref:hypothetical protein n=1 Tax=unclassified Microbacterium TaxID=2609290 RepID=UPI003313069E
MESLGVFADMLGKAIPAHGRDKALVDGGLEKFVAAAAARPGCVGVFVLLDGEGDCVAQLGVDLARRAASATGKPVVIALADGDFEDWIYASAETLELDLTYEETMSGQTSIKGALHPSKYVKPTWQPRLTSRMDLDVARGRSPSLDRALLRFEALLMLVLP